MAITNDSKVRTGSNETGAEGSYASTATKWVVQTPPPPATAARNCQPNLCPPEALTARFSSLRVIAEPKRQTSAATETNSRLCSFVMQLITVIIGGRPKPRFLCGHV